MVHTDMMKRDHHESIDATNTDIHDDINADVDGTASGRESGQNLSDTESEKRGSRRKPVFSKYIMLLEPIMFVYALYMGSVFPLMDQFVRAQISSKYNITSGGHNSTHIPGVCSRNSSRHRNDEVDAEASRWMLYANAATYLPGVVSLWMLGPYSDRQGRKVAIIVPQIGTLLRCISTLAVIYFDLPLYVMLIGAFIEGASGGLFMVVSAGFSYVADITKHENRSFRITVLDSFFSIGITVSQVATGYLIASVGYFYPFLILTAIILLDLVVAAIFLPETVTKDPLVRFWSFGHFRKAFNLYFRDNGTGRRWKLLLSLVIVFFSCSVTYASFDIQTFYLIDVPFCLSSIQIGYFGAMLSCISAPVSMLMTKFTLSIFGDSGLLLIGAVSTTLYEVMMTFSTRTFLIFMAPVLGAAVNLVPAMVRAIGSKLVKQDEEGAMFATIGVAIVMSVLVGQSVFNNLYSATVFVWAQLTFLVMTGTLAFTAVLALVYLIKERLERQRRDTVDQSDRASLLVNS